MQIASIAPVQLVRVCQRKGRRKSSQRMQEVWAGLSQGHGTLGTPRFKILASLP